VLDYLEQVLAEFVLARVDELRPSAKLDRETTEPPRRTFGCPREQLRTRAA
jgi:hypothetical protein